MHPIGQNTDIFGQTDRHRLCFSNLCEFFRKGLALALVFGPLHFAFELLTQGGASGSPVLKEKGQVSKITFGVKDITVTGNIVPGCRLSGPKARPTIGNGIIRTKALFGQFQQMHAPSGFVPVILVSQEVAVG